MTHRNVRSSLGRALVVALTIGGLTVAVALPGGTAVAATSAVPAAASTAADTVAVDFSATTGEFRGGASGSLYGLGDAGSPSAAVLAGAHVTNVSQKPPDGTQHPNGDALEVEADFFAAGGEDLYVYVQDMYPDWPYTDGVRPGDDDGDGVWDYLPVLREVVEKVATTSAHPEKYVFIPFNEPDGIWYQDWGTLKTQFLADWSAAYAVIQQVYAEHGLGHARVAGDGASAWNATRATDFLTYAAAHDELPDVMVWHELGTSNLATFRTHMAAYRALVTRLGIDEIPVNITEYAMPRDMNVPGQLVQWLAMFEDEKVDAQMAYWNYAGNLSDNASRTNSANGGWWMLKWYGDLAGTRTATLTPPQQDVADTVQGLAAVDTTNAKATVLVGGGTQDIDLQLSGLDADTFGHTVDVVVRRATLNGAEGDSVQPPVVLSTTVRTSKGTLGVTVPNSDRYSAYQVVVTTSSGSPEPVATDLVDSTEAEDATLVDVCAVYQNPSTEWSHLASGSHDVGCVNKATSSLTWDVTVPRDGTYRLDLLAGANQSPGKQALYVDGALDQIVSYAADLSWTYRGTAHATLTLAAGTHRLQVRASTDGTTLLAGSDITLDRLDLYDVTDGERAVYPSVDARLAGGASLVQDGTRTGAAKLSGDATATTYAAVVDTGYYDVTVDYGTTTASTVTLTVDGRDIALPKASTAGTWSSTARVYLPEGVVELVVGSEAGATVASVTTVRGTAQRATDADASWVTVYAPEDMSLTGTAAVTDLPAASNGVGGTDVEYLGNGAGSTATLARPSGYDAGEYQLVVAAANADKDTAMNYNPQVISRFIDIAEAGGGTVRETYRHNYAWQSFWNRTTALTLTTDDGDLTLGNATAWAPNVNRVTLAKFVASTGTTRVEKH